MSTIKFKVKQGRSPLGERQIISLSIQKFTRVWNLMSKYKEIGFTDYSLLDLAELSLTQWKRRDYPIPEGYRRDWTKILVKNTDQIESLREKYFTSGN